MKNVELSWSSRDGLNKGWFGNRSFFYSSEAKTFDEAVDIRVSYETTVE